MESIQELAQYFVYRITQSRVGIEARINSAMNSIPKLLERGWTLYEIKSELDQFAHDYPQVVANVYHIDEIMQKKEPPNNLMEPETFYYHNLLREVSPPPKIVRDTTGRMVRISEPFYLEMKKRFTMQELLDYWYQQMDIKPNEHMLRQDEGKFKYILGNYTLDEVLFSIDASKAARKDIQLRPLRNAFELDKYIDSAREFIQAKQNVHKLQKIDREIKRSDTNERYYGSGHPYN